MLKIAIRSIALATVLLWVLAAAAQAQGNGPGFHVTADFNDGCPRGQTFSSPTPPASLGPTTVPCVSGSGTAAAEAAAGTLRVLGRAEHACCGTASTASGAARILIENVVISGPAAASIPISMNFHLRGTLTGNPDFGQAQLFLFVALRGFNANLASTSQIEMSEAGIYNQTGVFAPVTLSFPNVVIDQTFTTHTVNAAPNTPLTLELQMFTVGSMGGLGVTQGDFFSGSNGFALPVGIPVFNLPDGYTIDIPELDVVANFWQAAAPPAVSVTPVDVNFGAVPVGTQSTSVVTATNTGGPGLQVHTIGLGAGSPAFSIVSVRKDGVNAALPVALDTNETLDIEVAFSPAAAGSATRTLIIGSSDPGQSEVVVSLAGEGVQVQLPPAQQIVELLEFFDASVGNGTLEGAGSGGSVSGRLKALRNMIAAAADFINASDLVEACRQLQDVLDRIDGNPRPPDFAAGTALEELRARVRDLRSTLGCP